MTLAEVLHLAADGPAPFNPDDSIDLIGLFLIYVLPSLVAAGASIAVVVLTVRGQKRGRAGRKSDRKVLDDVAEKVEVVRGEVKNDHPDEANLRDQIDRMEYGLESVLGFMHETQQRHISLTRDIGGIRDDVGGIRKDVGELRGADRAARADHDDLVRRLNGFIRREHPGADPL